MIEYCLYCLWRSVTHPSEETCSGGFGEGQSPQCLYCCCYFPLQSPWSLVACGLLQMVIGSLRCVHCVFRIAEQGIVTAGRAARAALIAAADVFRGDKSRRAKAASMDEVCGVASGAGVGGGML